MPSKEMLWVGAWYLVCVAWGALIVLSPEPVPYAGGIVVAAIVVADAGSYFFHYIIDHYGDPTSEGLVQEFQRHHLSPSGIVEKPLCEVLYPAACIATPVMALIWPLAAAGLLPGWFVLGGGVMGALWVFTQLFHRWSHMPQATGAVRWLQRLGVVVHPKSHACHHRVPFDSHFAVICGWTNWPLDRLGAPLMVDWLLGLFGVRKRELVNSLAVLRELEGIR